MSPMFRWGLPGDTAMWVALGLAPMTWLLCHRWPARWQQHRWALLVGLALLAGTLSLLYVHFYLGGGPRIIDATSYYLQAKALAHGLLSFEPLAPSGSFRGRFLTGPAATTRLCVIFPPGYPLYLAFGFLLGRPMWLGPLLAVGLVLLTYELGVRVLGCPKTALSAAALSTVCAALRYHTADTMSHAWAALLFAGCITLLTHRRLAVSAAAGLLAGWLVATRPVTGALLVGLSVYWLGIGRRVLAFGVALLPGLLLLAVHQHAATGHWLSSSQFHYYALSDGPPGCFRYGFGDSVGCLHEHGDVRQALGGHFGLMQALVTSIHRLYWHTLDVANFEPLWLLVPFGVFVGRRERAVRLLGLGCLGIVVAYAPFYFNGSYPGGGARFFADVLPLEHVLVALGLKRLGAVRTALPLSLLGFALHAGFSHRTLAQREGGQPMFSRQALERHGVRRGLVLVNTDHGFNLGYDPTERDAKQGLVIARERGDAHDNVLWETLQRPPAYRYRFSPWSAVPGPVITRRTDFETSGALSFEAEAEWPPLAINGGYARPAHVGANCASRGQVLKLIPSAAAVTAQLEVVALEARRYDVEFGWLRAHEATLQVSASIGRANPSRDEPERRTMGSLDFGQGPCQQQVLENVYLRPGPYRVLLTVEREGWLDFVRLNPSPPSVRPATKRR